MNKLLIVGTVASTQLKLLKTDKILGGAGTTLVFRFFFNVQSAIVSVVGDDFPIFRFINFKKY
jgi:hypothetical protein